MARLNTRITWLLCSCMLTLLGHSFSPVGASVSPTSPASSVNRQTASPKRIPVLPRRGGQQQYVTIPSPPAIQQATAAPAAYVALKTAPENFENAVALGVKKSGQSIAKIFTLGILAGFQVGIGAAFAVATLGGLPTMKEQNIGLAKILFGVVGLPCSLLMVMITGAELFTGNTALVGAAFMERKVKFSQLLKSWGASFAGNLLGGYLLAALCHFAGVFSAVAPTFAAVADHKASFSFAVAIARGIVCNWLVCTALWVSIAASDLASKAISTLMIITIFAALGFEHSVANMFIGPFAAFNGSQSGLLGFYLRNLLPVTVGNIIGGVVLCAGFQWLAFGNSWINKKK